MSFEIKKVAFYAIIYLLPLVVCAQDDKKYKEDAAAIRKEVWAWDRPEFNVRAIPEKYAGSSKVILARRTEIVADSRKKAKMIGLGFALYRAQSVTEIVRELVKINDKSAVEDYSEISYTQMERKSGFLMSTTTTVYIGVRVMKPDGTVREINADDIVLTKNESLTKQAKAAIPDLQPGDLVDYFIAKQVTMGQEGVPPYTFAVFDDSPILHYSITCDVGKKFAIEYRCYNGAPDFKLSKGEDDANVLEMEKKDIPAYPGNDLWVSPYRQLPIIRMNIMLGYKGLYAGRLNTRTPGQVYKNQQASEYFEDEMNMIAYKKMSYTQSSSSGLNEIAIRHLKKVKKNRDEMHPDSVAAEFFYAFRYSLFLDPNNYKGVDFVKDFGQRQFDASQYMLYMGLFLRSHLIKNNLVLATSKYGPDMKSILSKGDLSYMVLLTEGKQAILGADDMFSPAFYVPPQFENIPDAATVDTKSTTEFRAKNFDIGQTKTKGTTHEQNSRIEKLVITPVLGQSTLQVKRKSTLKGHYKSDVQKQLILFEDYEQAERKLLGEEKSLIEELESSKKTQKYAEELKAAFAEARKNQKDAFLKEAKGWYETDITNLTNHKIENLGVRHNNGDFIYSSEFTMGGLVKKAGNNFIVDIGKLQGTPLKIEDNQRQRNLNVYAPFARSIHYQITLEIPPGYTAEGVASLNKKVENESGAFTVDASSDGKIVTVNVSKIYKKAFEPAANWSNILAFMDAAVDWSNSKLLLKKQ